MDWLYGLTQFAGGRVFKNVLVEALSKFRLALKHAPKRSCRTQAKGIC